MASLEQKYIHDRLILLLVSISTFLTLLGSLMVLLRLDGHRNEGYIVQYRQSTGISDFKTGSSRELLAFVLFMFLVLAIHIVVSIRVYKVHRNYGVAVLGLGLVLQTLAIIVSNALLVLR